MTHADKENTANVKWCNGPCQRELSVDCFYGNGQGRPMAQCKACHRITVRTALRKRRRYNADFRRAERARHARYYQAHHAERLAYDRARRARVK